MGYGGFFEGGAAFTFKGGFDVRPYWTWGTGWGADASFGAKLTYNQPVGSRNMNFSDISGYSEGYNAGAWIFDGSYGGNSIIPGLNPNTYMDYHSNYNSYGLGLSWGLPGAFTRTKGYTYINP